MTAAAELPTDKNKSSQLEEYPEEHGPSNRMKWVLGGLGGLTPLIANLLILDVAVLDRYITNMFNPNTLGSLSLAGYCFRGVLLFLIGGFWAAVLHSSEQNHLKLFQLGVVAPAIIVGFMNSAEIRANREYNSESQPPPSLKSDSINGFTPRVNEHSPITIAELSQAFGITSAHAEKPTQHESPIEISGSGAAIPYFYPDFRRKLRALTRGLFGLPIPQFETVRVGPGDCNARTLTLRDNEYDKVFEISVLNNCSYIDWTTADSIAKSAAAATGLSRAESRWALLSREGDCDNMMFTLYDKLKQRIVQSTVKNSCSKIYFGTLTLPWQIAQKVAELNQLN